MSQKPKGTTAKPVRGVEEVEVGNAANAGAGKMIPFPSVREKVTLALPHDLAVMAREGTVELVTLHGKSLEKVGIYDGDPVLCKKVFSRKEIGAKTVCIVRLLHTGEVFAKRIRFRENMIVLRDFTDEIPDLHVTPDEVEIQGIVLYLVRPQDAFGRFDRGYDSDIPF